MPIYKFKNFGENNMNTHKNIKAYFIKYDEMLQSDIALINDTIFMKGYESYIPGCLDKTVKALEFLQNNQEWCKERFTNNNGLTILA